MGDCPNTRRGLTLNCFFRLCIPSLTAVMLLVQAICTPLAVSCSCRTAACSHRQSSDSPASCCCPTPAKARAKHSASPRCAHCKSQSPTTALAAKTEANCHCGEHSQQPLAPKGTPASSHSVTLSWIDTTATSVAVVNITDSPVDAQLPRGQVPTPNFRHVVLCVWLA